MKTKQLKLVSAYSKQTISLCEVVILHHPQFTVKFRSTFSFQWLKTNHKEDISAHTGMLTIKIHSISKIFQSRALSHNFKTLIRNTFLFNCISFKKSSQQLYAYCKILHKRCTSAERVSRCKIT